MTSIALSAKAAKLMKLCEAAGAMVSGCAVLLLCTAPGFGLAQTRDINPLLSSALSWDLNGDGIYTCDEWKVFVNKDPLFRDADLGYFDDDHDGRLSRREFVDKPSPFFFAI